MYKGRLVLPEGRDTNTGLWMLPIDNKKETSQQEKNMVVAALDLKIPQTHTAANVNHTVATLVYMLLYKQQQMKYTQQRF